MERLVWAKPEMNEVTFAANEYVAACDDTVNKFWEFVCNAGSGSWMDVYLGAWDKNKTLEENKANSTLLTPDTFILPGYYHACDIKHYVEVTDENMKPENVFAKGWTDTNYWDSQTSFGQEVLIWRGEDNDNVHCTTSLAENIKITEGNKS